MSVSSCGLLNDFLIVGINPRKSVKVIRMIEKTGLLVNARRIKAPKAPARLSLSDRVITFSPFVSAKPNITKDTTAVTPVTQAPGPPL